MHFSHHALRSLVTWYLAALWLVHSNNTALWLATGQTDPFYYSCFLAFGRSIRVSHHYCPTHETSVPRKSERLRSNCALRLSLTAWEKSPHVCIFIPLSRYCSICHGMRCIRYCKSFRILTISYPQSRLSINAFEPAIKASFYFEKHCGPN